MPAGKRASSATDDGKLRFVRAVWIAELKRRHCPYPWFHEFSRFPVKEVTRDGAPPIDLVDGDELAEKLKELALGVKTELVERVSIDTAWFESL
ncbi:hypothetical protein ACQE3E_22830 [Methylomonas sp. MED-D]|uniref:hypothetical protein n=1 Tax=unclassified Methylomonas TaxID=2608980 RepID=UPI0028A38C71|nr:hypothetical protein [Methylomonas sp. MV1]MDT4332802.1 hypothetical protein [Methylomonas sp. MV1]